VQVTGGDPTLRKRNELVSIVGRIADRGMRPTLMTNGIRAKRSLLEDLAATGLVDVAFHVDITQKRHGYDGERALNSIRQDYVERTRGLPLSVLFNTTVTGETLGDVPEIVEFFVKNSDVVRLASFQLQADTGRGTLGRRDESLTIDALQRQIEAGAGTSISFDALQIGHRSCSRYGMAFIINGRAYDALDDVELVQMVLDRFPHLRLDRRSRSQVLKTFAKGALLTPALWSRAVGWLSRKIWHARRDLVAARGKANKLSFIIHNFMDACCLDNERVEACTFMAATSTGPVSMCLYNTMRNDFLLRPVRLADERGGRFWDPLSGQESDVPMPTSPVDAHARTPPKGPRRSRPLGMPASGHRSRDHVRTTHG
jgi:hypothetical protein